MPPQGHDEIPHVCRHAGRMLLKTLEDDAEDGNIPQLKGAPQGRRRWERLDGDAGHDPKVIAPASQDLISRLLS